MERASWPYVQVSPNGIFLNADHTSVWKFVPAGCIGRSNWCRSPAKYSASWVAPATSTRVGRSASTAAGAGCSGR